MMGIERRRVGWLTFQALLFGIWLSQMQNPRCLVWRETSATTSQQTTISFQATTKLNNTSSVASSASASTSSSKEAGLSSPSSWPGKPSYDLTDENATHLIRIDRHSEQQELRQQQHHHQHPVSDARSFFLEHLDEFLDVYKNRPDRTNTCGIRFNHALAIFTITKRLQPTTIIESGVNAGQSTYFFRQASGNDTKIISIDPEVKPICGQPVRWIDSTKNEYLTGDSFVDFDAVNWKERIQKGEIDPANTLILIDDHQGFFKRFSTFVKYGFRHVMNEDNYKEKEGATRWDRANLTPKQMFRVLPQHADTTWLFANLNVYAEFPPLLSPTILAQNTTHARKVQGGFLHPTDDLQAIEEPLLRPDLNKGDADILERIARELQLDVTLQEPQSYQEFMAYCFLAYMEIVPLAPRLAQAWRLS